MQTYRVPKLDSTTPREAKTRLVNALNAVEGVETATLNPDKHQFTIEGVDEVDPTRALIQAASSKAGFTVSPMPESK